GLLLIGFMLILIEIFLIPGITLAGIGGGLAILGGVVYAYKHLGLTEAAWCLGAARRGVFSSVCSFVHHKEGGSSDENCLCFADRCCRCPLCSDARSLLLREVEKG
ncbi:MAG: hypothetical protein KAR36_01110, partial [Candidatus Latescibacteria bacterium]|nr:hypothetical protein [Candidatus Latescibacterota bacterium]